MPYSIQRKTPYILAFFLFCFLKTNAQTAYTFTGNGSWNIASNWNNDTVPSSIIPGWCTISIAPKPGDSCILNQPLVMLPGSLITVDTNSRFILTGNQGMPEIYPSNILNLTNWKITLPIDANGTQTGSAVEVDQPQLDTFSINPYFLDDSDYSGVIFM